MLKRSRTEKVKQGAVSVSELALELARDRTFRKRLLSALEHGSAAHRRVPRRPGLIETAQRIASDRALQGELRRAREDLAEAYARLEAKRRGNRLRTAALLAGVASAAGAVPVLRRRVSRTNARPRSLDDMTKDELYARAQEAEIPGRSEMSKEQLVAALRRQTS
jgi:hypothetical protein